MKQGLKNAFLYAFIVFVAMQAIPLLFLLANTLLDVELADPQWFGQNMAVLTIVLIPVALVTGYMRGKRIRKT